MNKIKRVTIVIVFLLLFAGVVTAQNDVTIKPDPQNNNRFFVTDKAPVFQWKPIEFDVLKITKPGAHPDPCVTKVLPNFIINSEDPAFIYRFKFSSEEVDLTEQEFIWMLKAVKDGAAGRTHNIILGDGPIDYQPAWKEVDPGFYHGTMGLPPLQQAPPHKVICPICRKEGRRSTCSEQISAFTINTDPPATLRSPSYDEDGNEIPEPPPKHHTATYHYHCSNGHDFSEER